MSRKTEKVHVQGWVDAIGTHWALDDPYVDWRRSPDWSVRVRGSLEVDGVPCDPGEPVYLSREQIEKERREQGSWMFALQMQNDPSPATEKPWQTECERFCTLKDAEGPGTVVVLSDPAPRAVGSVDGRDERWRKDGTKNWWANAVVKLRRKGELKQIIVLFLEQSKEWGLDEGMERLVTLAARWRASEIYAESVSSPVYRDTLNRVRRENKIGWKGHVIGVSGRPDDKMKNTYNAQAKVAYLVALADRAKNGELLICETVPSGEREVFLAQMRGFLPMPDGKTGLPFDDLANAVAFATDPYWTAKYPVSEELSAWSPFRAEQEEEFESGSRHVRW